MHTFDILVVDDSLILVKKLSMLLEKVGYRVVRTAATGNQAVAAYRACKPDVVTMDITMPDMDGIEATRAIISEFPDAKIIMVTSHGQEQMVLDALKAGAKGYVLKPFQDFKVYEAIQKACKGVVLLQDKLKAAEEQAEKNRLQREKEQAEQAEKDKLEASAAEQTSSELADANESGTRSSGSSQIEASANKSAQSAQPVATPTNSSQQQSRFCKECGNAIAADAKFCSGCGLRLA